METEWKPDECRIQVCLLFDEINFPVGDPTSANLESAATLNHDIHGLDLSKCVIDSVDVLSTEIKLGGDDGSDRPLFFFIKLFSADKLVTPTVLCSAGHPVGQGCGGKTYFKGVKRESEEKLAREFGVFLPWDDQNMQNNSRELLKKINSSNVTNSEITERGNVFQRFRADEHERDLEAWDSEIRNKVEKLFHNMTSVRAELFAVGNENSDVTRATSPILVRIVLDIRLRATKKRNC